MEEQMQKLEGSVINIIYHNKNNGYIVFNMDTENSSDLTTVVGELGGLSKGDKLIVEGNYINHSKFGTQFKAEYCEIKLPTEPEDIIQYLGNGNISGVGIFTAKKIVDTFGNLTFDIIENQPERLCEIKGITTKKANDISKQFKQIFHLKNLVKYLSEFKISSSYAMKCFNLWNFESLERIKENPYIMCCPEVNLPFDLAEKVAQSCNIEPTSDLRIIAGCQYVLNRYQLDGHTCMPKNIFLSRTCNILHIKYSFLLDFINKTIDKKSNDIILYTDSNNREYIYNYEYFHAESFSVSKILSMQSLDCKKISNCEKIIENMEKEFNISYDTVQKEAISKALNNRIMILTGGPGTGKTTTLKTIIHILKNMGLNVKITAPTGRATKRISEVTGYDALTIHRLLEVFIDERGNQVFKYNENNPLKCDVVVIDEMSMVDTLLFSSLLQAIPLECKLILVGDADQLPSVSAGNVLRDLINSHIIETVTLTQVFRQAQESSIIMNAHKIIKGQYPDIETKNSDFFFLQRLTSDKALQTIIELWKDRLPKAYKFNPFEDIQILSPSRKGDLGTVNINNVIQDLINPEKKGQKEIKNLFYTFRIGDKVMQIKNNYQINWNKNGQKGIGIYNGDIGIITNITSNGVDIDFDGKKATYSIELLDQLELAYAITVHKSQGSEFKAVIMPVLNNYYSLSYRNLLYTAITRAKNLLVIVGSYTELFKMVDNNNKMLRNTCLCDMITSKQNNDKLIEKF